MGRTAWRPSMMSFSPARATRRFGVREHVVGHARSETTRASCVLANSAEISWPRATFPVTAGTHHHAHRSSVSIELAQVLINLEL